ncbi:XAC2610-related protein [Winogradskyella vidalii]|uniref:XAC2610-related protein n=1 Tax=Winogradskyella vidalii TaxID=2615024 RepID=UPI0015C6BC67|nr:hypothetical protein [Winogradskyella vidalii]
MRTTIKLLLIIFIFGCKNQPKSKTILLSESKTEISKKQFTESIFDLIINKKESSKNFPDSIAYKFVFSKRFTEKEISVLNLDTTKIDLSEYYFLTNQKFLKKPIDSILFFIYFKHQYGDQLEKVLRVKKQNSNFDLVLAMEGGDSFSNSISTEFINDSTFISTYTHKVGDIISSKNNGKESTYEYYCDSIISKYRYDKSLDLKVLRIDTLQFSKQTFYRDNKILWSNLKAYSKPFNFQGKEYVWEYFIPNYDKSKGISYSQNLLENSSKKVILNGQTGGENYTETINNLYEINNLNAETKDINLDEFKDISFYNSVKSGTAGEFTDVYLFNSKEDIFEYSEIFSGYNVEYESDKNRISSMAKSGAKEYYFRYINLKENKKDIDFTETIHHYFDTIFYKKSINEKIINERKIVLKEFENWKKYLERK